MKVVAAHARALLFQAVQKKTLCAVFCLFQALLAGGVAQAADLYKYQDEKGRWVFTDKKPRTQKYTRETMLITELPQKVSVVNRGSREKLVLYGVNSLAGPAQVWLELKVQKNIHLHPSSDSEWLLHGPGEEFLTYVSPVEPQRPWAYQWATRFVEGRPVEPADLDSQPLPPPLKGGPFYITQAFHGKASHQQHPSSHKAVDIYMPEGSPVAAVRAGTVMDVEQDFSRSGWRADVADEANYVRILHPDGSMAIYAHLQAQSIQVSLGQEVEVGQVLAKSGNTGYSTGPHLHFALQYNAGRKLQSLAFKFIGFDREPRVGDRLIGR